MEKQMSDDEAGACIMMRDSIDRLTYFCGRRSVSHEEITRRLRDIVRKFDVTMRDIEASRNII